MIPLHKRNYATQLAKGHRAHYTRLVDNFTNDPKRTERLAECVCLYCKYVGRMATCDIREWPCKAEGCDNKIHGPSAGHDMYCKQCAIDNYVCRRCGADLDLKTRRV